MKTEEVDICVVGAGISGLSLAAFASKYSRVCVLESSNSVVEKAPRQNVLSDRANGWLDNESSVQE